MRLLLAAARTSAYQSLKLRVLVPLAKDAIHLIPLAVVLLSRLRAAPRCRV